MSIGAPQSDRDPAEGDALESPDLGGVALVICQQGGRFVVKLHELESDQDYYDSKYPYASGEIYLSRSDFSEFDELMGALGSLVHRFNCLDMKQAVNDVLIRFGAQFIL